MNTDIQILLKSCSQFLWIYLRVELLDRVVVLFIFWRYHQTLIMAVLSYIPSSNAQVSQFFYILAKNFLIALLMSEIVSLWFGLAFPN